MNTIQPPIIFRAWAALSIILLLARPMPTPAAPAAANLDIYSDSLAAGWDNWSWDTTVNFSATGQAHAGTRSLSVVFSSAWAGLSLHAAAPLDASGYTAVDFWAYGDAGGTQVSLSVQPTDGGEAPASKDLTFPAGAWTHYTVTLSELGSPDGIARLNWQERSGAAQPIFYLDEIRLLGTGEQPPAALTLTVNASANRRSIPPEIYGMNEFDDSAATLAFLDEIDLPLRRWGGNATSRYNYQTDISNHAFDWYFENIKESDATNLPYDSAANRFIAANRSHGIDTLLTIPMMGYVSNSSSQACGFSIAKYGAQTDNDAAWRPDCGNGVRADGSRITGNDPLDASIAIDPAFVANWINHLKGRFGDSLHDGVRFYNLDNEPDLWWETHRDIAPTGVTYDQLRDRSIAYAAAIKGADPQAYTVGPATGVWTYFFISPYDGQREDWATPDDTLAHGGAPLTAWYLQQMRAYEQAHGVRLLDYLDLHYYPQSGVALEDAGSASLQALRLRSTRSLWDPAYVDESWIAQAGPDNGIVRLIPRMRAWVDANYPDTKLAIGEYNWGALDHINGALAQADVLGIFGREGVDLAALWDPPAPQDPGAFAFRMYRNYDGAGGKFGDVRIQAASSDQAKLTVYAAQRSSDGALTLMAINKTGATQTATLHVGGANLPATGRVYRYSVANLNAIQRLSDQALGPGVFSMDFAANSITLIVIQPTDRSLWKYVYLPHLRR